MQDFNSLLYDLYINALIILLIPFPCQNHLLYTQQIFLIVSPNFHALVLYTHPTRPTNIFERTFLLTNPYSFVFIQIQDFYLRLYCLFSLPILIGSIFFLSKTRILSEAKFKEFEPRLKHGWFYLKLYSLLRDFSRRSMNRFWAVQRRDLNSSNSVSVHPWFLTCS